MSSVCRPEPPRSVSPHPLGQKIQGIEPSVQAPTVYENMAHRNPGNVTVELLKEERTQYRSQLFFPP